MKHVILVRHATAEPDRYPQSDFERNLEPSGQKEALALGNFLAGQAVKPKLILTSAAHRTLQTAEIFSSQIGLSNSDIEADKLLYNAGFQTLIKAIQNIENQNDVVAMVAHNPGISQTSTALSSVGAYQMAPGSALCLVFEINSWSDLMPASGKEIWYFIPKV
jgi:phosphohistidine phosphatase